MPLLEVPIGAIAYLVHQHILYLVHVPSTCLVLVYQTLKMWYVWCETMQPNFDPHQNYRYTVLRGIFG